MLGAPGIGQCRTCMGILQGVVGLLLGTNVSTTSGALAAVTTVSATVETPRPAAFPYAGVLTSVACATA